MRTYDPSLLTHGAKHLFAHISISLLAVGIAFGLPDLAEYILYFWWPRVENSSRLLLTTEITFAAALVLLLNIAKLAWDSRRNTKLNKIASLVHAKETEGASNAGSEKELIKQIVGVRDMAILSVTGKEIVAPNSWVSRALKHCSEVRVLLMNPDGPAALRRAQAAKDAEATLAAYRNEIQASLDALARINVRNTKVTVRFYDTIPLWQMVVAGEYLWLRYGFPSEEGTWPEYVFSLQKDRPRRGFYTPFFVYFLAMWNAPEQLQYDFRCMAPCMPADSASRDTPRATQTARSWGTVEDSLRNRVDGKGSQQRQESHVDATFGDSRSRNAFAKVVT